MAIQKVALIGANGNLGPSILRALLAEGTLPVTVLTRRSSRSIYPDSVQVVYVSDEPSVDEWATALTGQEALITTFGGVNGDLQIRLADAAVRAGVERFIPADFGSCDSSDPRSVSLVPIYYQKQRVRHYLQELASATSLSWTSLVCGHFLDYGLRSGLLQFDLPSRTARIFDGGQVRWSASSLDFVARATVAVLRNDQATKNRMLYVHSFSTTQNEVLQSLERITGRPWQVEATSSDTYIRHLKGLEERDPHDHDTLENLVSVEGIVNAYWMDKADFANSLLDLEEEDVDQVIERVLVTTS